MKQAIDWVRIQAEYVASSISYRDLALKHGVSYRALRKRGNRGNWSAERREHARQVTAAFQKKTLTTRVEQLEDWNAKDLSIAKVLRAKLSRRLLKIPEDAEDPSDNLRELHAIVVAAEACQRLARLALGATTSNQAISAAEPTPNAPTLREWYATIEKMDAKRADGDVDADDPGKEQKKVTKGEH